MTSSIRFDDQGLVPAVVQDTVTGDVLMLAYMNDEALHQTRATGRAHYWSRSRNALWRKGETSGHEQLVEEIRINCEENSLLLVVRQTGAVCHTGYPTCFYRRIEADDTLTVVRARTFDPADVYASIGRAGPVDRSAIDPLAEATREQYGAYAFLRDNDLTARSSTSVRLRTGDERVQPRLADELRELAGALDGTHRHQGGPEDVSLEASQVIYWALLVALSDRIPWSTLRPDLALAMSDPDLTARNLATLLRRDADRWESAPSILDRAARLHATLALVGQACCCKGLDPLTVIERDLAELRARSYLRPYFTPGNE